MDLVQNQTTHSIARHLFNIFIILTNEGGA